MKGIFKLLVNLAIVIFLLGASGPVPHQHGDRQHSHVLPEQGVAHAHGTLPSGRILKNKVDNSTDENNNDYPPTNQVNKPAKPQAKNIINPLPHPPEKNIRKDHGSKILFQQAVEYYQIGEYEKSVQLLRNALTSLRKKTYQDPIFEARIRNLLGLTYLQLGMLSNSLENLQTSLNIRKKILPERHPEIAVNYSNIGSVYQKMGDFRKTISYFEKSIEILTRIPTQSNNSIAVIYNNIGTAYTDLGNYPKAILNLEKALAVELKLKKNTDIATTYNNIGLAYKLVGDFQKANYNLKKALNIRLHANIKNYTAIAQSYNNLGNLFSATGNFSQAIEYHQAALAIKSSTLAKNHPSLATSYSSIGAAYDEMGSSKMALENHQIALKIRQAAFTKDHPDIASSYNNIGLTYKDMGNFPEALKFLNKALTIKKSLLPMGHPDISITYSNLSGLYQSMDDSLRGYKMAETAFNLFVNTRDYTLGTLSTQQKIAYSKSNYFFITQLFSAYRATLNSNNLSKKNDKKVHLSLINSWLTYKGSILSSDNSLLHKVKNSRNFKINYLYDQLLDLQSQYTFVYQGQSELNRPTSLNNKLSSLAKKQKSLSQAIIKADSSFKSYIFNTPVSINEVKRSLNVNETYIDIAFIKDNYYGITINQDSHTIQAFSESADTEIKKAIKVLQRDIHAIVENKVSPSSMLASTQAAMAKLYPLFMSNIKPYLKGKDTLIISPDGPLRLLPFEALYDEQSSQYLIEQYSIRYVANAKEQVRLHLNQQAKATGKHSSVVLANPNFDYDPKATSQPVSGSLLAGFQQKTSPIILANNDRSANDFTAKFNPLQYTQTEANNIVSMLRYASKTVQDLRQNEATESALLSVKSPEILHIATHGFFNSSQTDPMMQSGLIMASANTSISKGGQEGIVYALDLSGLDLTGTELVVLSACNTGRVDPNNTVGISSLSKAFIQAGAKDVVMSLWSVADKETASLMTEFYKASQQGNLSYSDALRQSKLKMIKEGLHPFYWAPFILSGL